jgi:hypothetical protein
MYSNLILILLKFLTLKISYCRYIYGGILSLNEQDTSEFLKILVAADVLCLQELVDYLQNYLIESKSEQMEKHFIIMQRI